MNNVHFAIPEIYGETLSYYELLRKLVDKTNELIENYNTVPEQIAEAVANLDASQLFSTVLNQLIHSIATDNTKSANAVKVYKKHDLLYATFNDTVNLYESLIDFTAGTETELIPGTNIREVNISELFIELRKLIDINKNNIEAVKAVANENTAEITTIHGDITDIENKNTEQDNEITTIHNDITAVENKNTEQDNEITTIHNDITAVENKNTEQDNELSKLRTMISSPYNFKGEVANISALPASGEVNDTYYVQDVKYKVTWTGSAWVQSSLSEADYQTELNEIKIDLHKNRQYELVNGIYTVTQASLINGDYGVGGVIHSDSRYLRVPNFVNVPKGSYIGFIGGTNINVLVIGIYNIKGSFIEERTIESNKGYVFTYDCKAVICFRNNTMSNITPSEYDATTIIVNSALYQFDVSGRKKYIVQKSEITQNMLDYNGDIYTYETKSNRLYNQHFLKVKKGDCVMLNADSKIYKYGVMFLFDIETINRANISWFWYTESEVIKMPQDGYLYLTIAPQSDSTTITQTDYNDNIVIYPTEYGFNFTIDLEVGSYADNEYGEYSAERINFNNHRRNKYPTKTNGAEFVTVSSDMNNITSLSVIEYNENRTKIRSTQLASTPNSLSNGQIKLSNSCEYIEVELYGETEKLPNSIDLVFYGGEKAPEATKRIARMNFPTTASDQLLYSVEDDVYSSLRLILPSNYSTEGNKVPLIVWLRGSSASSSWTDDFNSANYYPTKYFEYLRDEGFAVCAILTWGSHYIDKYGINVENASPYPTPTCRKVFVEGIKYVCDRYNVDIDNVHLLGHSQGGQLETFYVTNPDIPFKSICMFSPVNDYLSMPGDRFYSKTRQAIAEDLGLEGNVEYFVSDEYRAYTEEGVAFLQSNIDKINQLNEAWNSMIGGTLQSRFDDAIKDCTKFWENGTAHPSRTDIYVHPEYAKIGRVPAKVWGAPDDDQTPYRKMTEIVSQIKNGGGYAEMRSFESGGHFAPVSSYKINSVTTKLGTVYTDLPSGWKEAVDFMRVCMTKH